MVDRGERTSKVQKQQNREKRETIFITEGLEHRVDIGFRGRTIICIRKFVAGIFSSQAKGPRERVKLVNVSAEVTSTSKSPLALGILGGEGATNGVVISGTDNFIV